MAIAVEITDERQIVQRMDELAVEYSRTHDEKIEIKSSRWRGNLSN